MGVSCTPLEPDATYGRMDPAGTMTLLELLGRSVDLWPFGLSPTMFEVVEWLEQRGWEWNLSRDNIPEHVLDDPDWREHQWSLTLSARHRPHLALCCGVKHNLPEP